MAKTILLHRSRCIVRKVEGDGDVNEQKEGGSSDRCVSRGVIGRTAYANAASGSTGMR